MALPAISLTSVAAGTGGFALIGTAGERAGISVAGAGDLNGDGFADVVVGADQADPLSRTDAGRAFVVFGKPSGLGPAIDLATLAGGTAGLVVSGAAGEHRLGASVATAGDIDGDGLADLLVGSPRVTGAFPSVGAGFVVPGAPSGLSGEIDADTLLAGSPRGFYLLGTEDGERIGQSVAGAGDVDGDGLADIILGAPFADPALRIDAGRASVVFGRTDAGDPVNLDVGTPGVLTLQGAASGGLAGFAVAGAGDLNGDGLADVAVGAFLQPQGSFSAAGAVHVVFGSAGGFADPIDLAALAPGAGITLAGAATFDRSGRALAAAGDVNGDGLGDLLIGAPGASVGTEGGAGKTYVLLGTAGGFPASVALSDLEAGKGGFAILGVAAFDNSGAAVAGLGDINGDGYDDILIGANGVDGPAGSDSGRAYVVLGGSGFAAPVSLADIAAGLGGFAIDGESSLGNAGIAVGAAGDVNGDGFADMLVGASGVDRSYVVYGADFAGTVTHPGGTGADALDGTVGADSMVGGLGDDVLDGKGGADALAGGAGNDTLRIADTAFRRADGGSGTDTLALDGAGMTLDLDSEVARRLRGLERIDLGGSGDHTLRVSARALLNLSDTANALTVEAGAGDRVELLGSGWTGGALAGGYRSFANGNAGLLVGEGAEVVPCFAAGTRIRTVRGEVAVQALVPGDLVVLAGGGFRPVRWIGHRRLVPSGHPRPWDVLPVRIAADAFGPGAPHADLRLSPDHAVFVAGRLVPVRHLVNGATIVQEPVDEVAYYHVELAGAGGIAAHDVVLAEGLAVESFLDTGNRGAFANGGGPIDIHPDFARRVWMAAGCAPLLEEGPVLDDLRTTLFDQAKALGHRITREPAPRLLVDGRALVPTWRTGWACGWALPAEVRSARLISRQTVPAWFPGGSDRRALGVAVAALRLDGAVMPLDDARLQSGWYPAEAGWRWTDGDATLPCAGAGTLLVALAPLERYWRAPAAEPSAAAA